MFDLMRLSTLHPALVHLPLGVIPLVLVAYALAASQRSERWMFAGDVALGFASISALLAAALGYVAYFSVQWPGGLDPWPLAHLIGGTTTTLAVWIMAALRWRSVRRDIRSSAGPQGPKPHRLRWAVGALGLTVLVFATGYIGGEVLVFHAGIGVKAASHGALAPPLSAAVDAPQSLHDSMHRMRAYWARSVGGVAQSVVNKPSAVEFEAIAEDARRIERLARWLVDWGHQGAHGDGDPEVMREHAGTLQRAAQRLESAATQRDLADTIDALGAMTRGCAECHLDERWSTAGSDQRAIGGGPPTARANRVEVP
jgi:uncharacterized membrane protein